MILFGSRELCFTPLGTIWPIGCFPGEGQAGLPQAQEPSSLGHQRGRTQHPTLARRSASTAILSSRRGTTIAMGLWNAQPFCAVAKATLTEAGPQLRFVFVNELQQLGQVVNGRFLLPIEKRQGEY